VAIVAILAGIGLWAAWPGRRPIDHRAEIPTPYRNARPGVSYVGDAQCTRCHAEIAATYRRHPMGRSLAPIEQAPHEVRAAGLSTPRFEASGFEYKVELHDGRTIHRETRRDSRGRAIGVVEAEARYVLGSGSRAFSFLFERDGYLFESPLTWYAQQKRWDLSPGYEHISGSFERQATPGCLFCHANRVENEPGTFGRYRPPTFRGHAIGCERCHGPGELHVRQPLASNRIVNPRDLEPALRESICQQCHLIGEASILRAGRDRFDYRPGLPWHKFVDVFVRASESGSDTLHANGHVEQMYASRCFRASRGALGCISCHDPHRLPGPAERVSYYRDRCLECHAERGCSLAEGERRRQSPEDSCIVCHMPRTSAGDIPHVATTVHRIPRRVDRAEPAAASVGEGVPNLVPFHRDVMNAEDRRDISRDLGIALAEKGVGVAGAALPLLKKTAPDDVDAREALGYALRDLGRIEAALEAFAGALELAPGRESSLVAAAYAAALLGKIEEAISYWRRAIAVDPWRSDYHAGLAHELARARSFAAALRASRRAIELNPANTLARVTLIECLVRSGSRPQARAEFERLLEFDPPDRAGLTRWFESLR
jgi:Flp pilus assembly protein TadD